MKKKFLFLMSLLTTGGMLIPGSVLGSFVVTPTSGVLNTTRWESNVNGNLNASAVGSIVGVTLVSRYKSDVSGSSGNGSDSGTFAASYNTLFSNAANDPQDFDITWNSPNPFINDSRVFLLVKDGNQSPNQYIFDISRQSTLFPLGGINTPGWDGKATIQARGFWPAQGSISHIEIFGSGIARPADGPTPIPEPTSLAIFATGLVCLVSRRFGRLALV